MIDRKGFIVTTAASIAGSLLGGTAIAGSAGDDGFDQFCELFYRQRRVREAFETHVAADYIQHSAGMAQGREAAIQVLEPMFNRPQFSITPLRTLRDSSLRSVILDVRVGDAVRALVIDIYRLDGTHIVEHWDVKAELEPARRQGYFEGFLK